MSHPFRQFCTCPSDDKIDANCPIALPHPWHRGWRAIETAPKGVLVEGLNADGDIDHVEWRETRQCMLSTVAHGAGECGAGWISKEAGNLPVDPPTAWRPICSGHNS